MAVQSEAMGMRNYPIEGVSGTLDRGLISDRKMSGEESINATPSLARVVDEIVSHAN